MCYIVIVPKNLSKFHMTYTVEGTYTSKAKLQAGISERKGRGINKTEPQSDGPPTHIRFMILQAITCTCVGYSQSLTMLQ